MTNKSPPGEKRRWMDVSGWPAVISSAPSPDHNSDSGNKAATPTKRRRRRRKQSENILRPAVSNVSEHLWPRRLSIIHSTGSGKCVSLRVLHRAVRFGSEDAWSAGCQTAEAAGKKRGQLRRNAGRTRLCHHWLNLLTERYEALKLTLIK